MAYVIAAILALAVGLAFGEINGMLVAYGKIPPFIVTLGTMKIFRSVTQYMTQRFNRVVPAGFKNLVSFKVNGQVAVPTFLCDAVRGLIIIFAVPVQLRKWENFHLRKLLKESKIFFQSKSSILTSSNF